MRVLQLALVLATEGATEAEEELINTTNTIFLKLGTDPRYGISPPAKHEGKPATKTCVNGVISIASAGLLSCS